MSSNARSILAWTLALSLAACAADGDPAHEEATIAPLVPPQAAADEAVAAQADSTVAAFGPTAVAQAALDPQVTGAHAAASAAAPEPATTVPVITVPVEPVLSGTTPAVTPTEPTAAPSLTGVIANIGIAHPQLGLAGHGTLELAAKVRISELLAGLGLSTLAEAAIDVHGGFSAQLRPHGKLLIAEVLDAAGNVLGGTIVGLTSRAGGEIALAPITVESSLALKLFLKAAALPCSEKSGPALAGLALNASLLAHSGLGTELAASLDVSANGEVLLDALAEAFLRGHHARLAVLLDAGVAVDAAHLLDGALEALAKLNASTTAELDAKLASGARATDIQLSLTPTGIASDVHARAEVAASLALGASLRASIAADASLAPLLFPAVHAAARLEVGAALPAIAADLTVSGASDQLSAKIRAAGSELALDVRTATNLSDLSRARSKYLTRLYRDPTSEGLIGDLLGATTSLVTGVLDPVLSTIDGLTSELDAKLALNLSVSGKAGLCTGGELSVELDTSLQGIVGALLDFQTDVRAASIGLVQVGVATRSDALADILATAELVLRVDP